MDVLGLQTSYFSAADCLVNRNSKIGIWVKSFALSNQTIF